MNTDTIHKIISGQCSEQERKSFFTKVASDPELAKQYAAAKNKHMFNTLPYAPVQRKVSLPAVLYRVAAILLIPLVAWNLYLQFNPASASDVISQAEVTGLRYWVNPGVKSSFVLPDSTVIWLNSDSELIVADDFGKENRVVSLVGEGYFCVHHDVSSPFYIKTGKGITVKVTGTEFNLRCYDNDEDMSITLVNGAVDLIKEATNEVVTMKPSEQLTMDYETENAYLHRDTDVDYQTAWKKGTLCFDSAPLTEVVRRIERWYGATITIDDPVLETKTFTADFESESLVQVLEFMKMAIGLKYDISGTSVTIHL